MLIKLNDGERLVIETNDKHPQGLAIICEGNWLGVRKFTGKPKYAKR